MNAKIWGAIAVALVLGACGAKKEEAAEASADAAAAASDAAASAADAAAATDVPPLMRTLLLPTRLPALPMPLPSDRCCCRAAATEATPPSQ